MSYLIADKLLGANADIIVLLVLVLLFSAILYYIIYFIKGVMLALKSNRKLLWIPLYIFCVTLTCILPVWIVFDIINAFFISYAENNQQLLTWICTLAFGLYVYGRYHFLTNIAPVKAFPYYQRGIILANYWCNLTNRFKARKSREYM